MSGGTERELGLNWAKEKCQCIEHLSMKYEYPTGISNYNIKKLKTQNS